MRLVARIPDANAFPPMVSRKPVCRLNKSKQLKLSKSIEKKKKQYPIGWMFSPGSIDGF
jgi:hypothetical protein